jgi:hypothetical protein
MTTMEEEKKWGRESSISGFSVVVKGNKRYSSIIAKDQ